MHILEAVLFMHIVDAVIVIPRFDVVIFMHIVDAFIFIITEML